MYIPHIPEDDELVLTGGGRRLAMAGNPDDDWYASVSPRNRSYCAEGTWADWVQLAEAILKENERRQEGEE